MNSVIGQVSYKYDNASGVGNSIRPETQMESDLAALESELNSLGITSEALHQRLSVSVLRPDNVQQLAGRADPPSNPVAARSAIAERIGGIAQRVRNITAQQQNALDRLEA